MLQILVALLTLFTVYKICKRKWCKPNYQGSIVWITGASSGIGEYLAYEFSKYGANLIITARNQGELNRVKNNCKTPDKVFAQKLDMSDFQQIQLVTKKILNYLEAQGKKVDVLVENAGISMRCKFSQYHFDNHKTLFDVNVHGPYCHIKCLLPHMIRNKGGHIVAITSAAGKLASTYRSSYAASKHALIALLDSLRAEVRNDGIHVTNIMPGYVATNLSKNALVGGVGEKLGYTDKNIANGLSPQQFSKECVKAVFRKQKELQISKGLLIPVGILMRNISPDLSFYLLWKNGKNQVKALEKDC